MSVESFIAVNGFHVESVESNVKINIGVNGISCWDCQEFQ